MKTIKILIVFLFFFVAIIQKNFAQTEKDDNFSLQLRFAPLSLIDPNTPSFQVGAQIKFHPRWAVSLDYGQRFELLDFMSWVEREKRRYFKLKSEVKFFLKKDTPLRLDGTFPYVSAEFLFIPFKFRKNDSYVSRSEGKFDYEYSDITKNISAYAIKVGWEFRQDEVLILDLYVGLGGRSINQTHRTFNEQVTPSMTENGYSGFPSLENDHINGVYSGINFTLGFKLAYVLID